MNPSPNCPHCKAERVYYLQWHYDRPEDAQYDCGYITDEPDYRPDLCLEREARQKAETEIFELKELVSSERNWKEIAEKENERLEVENHKLREQVKELKETAERIGCNRFARLCKAEAENQKFRELANRYRYIIETEFDAWSIPCRGLLADHDALISNQITK